MITILKRQNPQSFRSAKIILKEVLNKFYHCLFILILVLQVGTGQKYHYLHQLNLTIMCQNHIISITLQLQMNYKLLFTQTQDLGLMIKNNLQFSKLLYNKNLHLINWPNHFNRYLLLLTNYKTAMSTKTNLSELT